MSTPSSTGAPTGNAWSRTMLASGAVLGFLTVAMAALAAHLPDRLLPDGGRALLRSAVEMQGWHIPALLVCGLLLGRTPRPLLKAASLGFLAGLACFCAGLYTLVFGGSGAIAHLAPIGGSLLMLSWLLLAICGATNRRA